MKFLRVVWETWKRFGQMMGDVIARVVLTLFYFTVFVPFGLGVRLFGDSLGIKMTGTSQWRERTPTTDSLDEARRLA